MVPISHLLSNKWTNHHDSNTFRSNLVQAVKQYLHVVTISVIPMCQHVACTLCRCSKLERDVKQKRSLIEDYRRKQSTVNEMLSGKDADIVSSESK